MILLNLLCYIHCNTHLHLYSLVSVAETIVPNGADKQITAVIQKATTRLIFTLRTSFQICRLYIYVTNCVTFSNFTKNRINAQKSHCDFVQYDFYIKHDTRI